MRTETYPQNELLKGTLDMMIVRTLIGGDAHGRWRQMTRAIGLVPGEERGAQ